MSLIGTGIDIVEVERIKRLLEKQKQRFLDRVFTKAEVEYCMSKAQPAVHLAARFAAKEAISKALGTGFTKGVRMRDIEVVTAEEGAPSITLHGAAARRYDSLGGTRILLSLSHTQTFALAHADIC
ncbi:MAG: holo-[acyl-carrier-protein] synthase [Candidatus Abyssobacteria bacterium SURF_17]|uniref:Holo-[acyl-carrier-protein] synthase n=1 Tax=Candidatus Abyssobacteria bacterium SURF_17 TaxID=2093361 RepID=A0A419EQ06_9BACT|nr:MAG: holo-[acyl-carrier-protein] synthase [Candidatus Abyssubacteria bacterium SURF_17]